MDFLDTLIVLIILPIMWVLFTIPLMINIRYEARKKYRKNEKKYPYFHYPVYKKLFLLGLRGALNTSVVVMTFIFNISLVLCMVFGIWEIISGNLIISYCFRAVLGVYGISWFLKLALYLGCPLNF